MTEHAADVAAVQDSASQPPRVAVDVAAIAADIEAMLLASGRTVPAVRLAVALGLVAPQAADEAPAPDHAAQAAAQEPTGRPNRKRTAATKGGFESPDAVIAAGIELLNDQYEKTGRSFRIERIAGGYRFMTLARHAKAVAALQQDRDATRLSRPAIETLAIIAYRQPVTRAELEAIRGVACGEVVRSLMERRLIAIVGRSEELGRPMLYGTTKHFLDAFGLASLKDLPSAQDLKSAL